MRYLIIILLLSQPTKAKAQDPSVAFDFARMKSRSDYSNDLKKQADWFVLWVDHEDLELYSYILKNHPNTIHCFITQTNLTGVPKGVVVGRRGSTMFEQVKVTNQSKEVILTFSTPKVPGGIVNPIITLSNPVVVKSPNCPNGNCPLPRK